MENKNRNRKMIYESEDLNSEWISLGKFTDYIIILDSCIIYCYTIDSDMNEQIKEIWRGCIKDIPDNIRCLGMVQADKNGDRWEFTVSI